MTSALLARARIVAGLVIILMLSATLAGTVPSAAASGPLCAKAQRRPATGLEARDLLPRASINGAIYFGRGHRAQAEEVAALLLMLVLRAQSGAHPLLSATTGTHRACAPAAHAPMQAEGAGRIRGGGDPSSARCAS